MISNFQSKHGSNLVEVSEDLKKFTELCRYAWMTSGLKRKSQKESTVYQQESGL